MYNSYPLAHETIYGIDYKLRTQLKSGETKNLIQSLYDKEKYLLHYTNFILYL